MLFKRLKKKPIVVVSGLPRSGTSMMMQMLQKGGAEIVSDGLRQADKNNPKGYYEFEKVKQMQEDHSWLDQCPGKVIKIVSVYLKKLPDNYRYSVIFMRRNMQEILTSQKKMLVRLNQNPDDMDDEKLEQHYNKHLAQIQSWLHAQKKISVLYVDYRHALEQPAKVANEVRNFLKLDLNTERMTASVDKSLYRNRA